MSGLLYFGMLTYNEIMNMKRLIGAGLNRVMIAACVAVLCVVSPAGAISSPNFTIQEDFLGGSGSPQSGSNNYRARDGVGGGAAGKSKAGTYQTDSGPVTEDEPTLSFSVGTSSVNLGSLSTSLTRTGTSNFSVSNYTSYGYVVQTVGNPPDNGGHTLAGIPTPAASTAGTEQYGINLVANTSPTALGADPVQVPDASFGFGEAAPDYATPDVYKYVSGDVIANAPKSSGRTDYTISYIANISNNTSGGSYSGDQTLVVVGTY